MNYDERISQIIANLLLDFTALIQITDQIKQENEQISKEHYKVQLKTVEELYKLNQRILVNINSFEYYIQFYPNKEKKFANELQQIDLIKSYIQQLNLTEQLKI